MKRRTQWCPAARTKACVRSLFQSHAREEAVRFADKNRSLTVAVLFVATLPCTPFKIVNAVGLRGLDCGFGLVKHDAKAQTSQLALDLA